MSEFIILNRVINRDTSLENGIKECSSVQFYKKNEMIYYPDDNMDGLFYIHKGSTKHYMVSPFGTEKVLYRLSEGWLFGEPNYCIRKEGTVLFSCAYCDTEIWTIETNKCTELLNTNARFRKLFLDCMSYKVLYLRQELESCCFGSCKERLIRTLAASVDESRIIDDNWYAISENYSHYELSILINCARVTVTKTIKELCDERFIRIVNHKVQVNIDAYKKMFGE